MTTCRTSRLIAPGTIELTDAPSPAPAPGEALIEPTAVGVCGSDMHWYRDGYIGGLRLGAPLTLGHEPAGVVRAVGEGVDRALVGRRVAVEPAIHCGRCSWCLAGQTNICPEVRFLGTPPTDGAFREAMTHPAHLLAPLPDSIDDDMGALLEPLAIGLHVMDLLGPRLGANVVIQGAGPVGLSCLLAARLTGPQRIAVIEPLEYRRNLAREMGAERVCAPDDADALDDLRRWMDDYGADHVVEAAGTPESFAMSVQLARPGAKVAIIGIDPDDRFVVNGSIARRKGLTLWMVRRSRRTLERAIALTDAGRWRPEPMITHRRGLADLAPTLDLLADYSDGVVKAVIHPRR